ncbi:NrfD/PsrC family molybdoenzyme membrane anchor subunit [Adlercreutzia sp. R7]|uniref:NrfD/PsrC family molybdoenzyme membrane anchor subunit n=1 Tax=Adlercreutzia wanghongyangiae TaxID=3111451 RepID=A0ABU6IIN4_9ACTN|nr:NrfD/PsrC family molybdoenzyme membrane anchor subunit [Adlercreutzia sp. R7]
MFGELVAAYLFLAGTGAGGIAAASLVDLLVVRAPCGAASAASVADTSPAERLVAYASATSASALVAGAACLIADVGRADRVLALFFTPGFTFMNVGAWALTALITVGAALALVRFLYLPWVGRAAVAVLEVAAVALAFVVAVYAGLLLQGLAGVRLWSSGWVPVLFVLSAASCGCALVAGCALFVEADGRTVALGRAILRSDAVVVGAEALAGALFLAGAAGSDHPGVAASVERLLHGSAALPWWCGFVLCGLAAPLAIEAAFWLRERRRGSGAIGSGGARSLREVDVPAAFSAPAFAVPPVALVALAALVLAGGAGLRWAVVEAGEQRPLELQEVEADGSAHAANPAGGYTEDGEREEPSLWLS